MTTHRITLPERLRKVWSRGGRFVWSVPVEPTPPTTEAVKADCGATYRWAPEFETGPRWWVLGPVHAVRKRMGCEPVLTPPYQPGDVLLVGADGLHRCYYCATGWAAKHPNGFCTCKERPAPLRARVLSVGAPAPVRDVTSADAEAEGFVCPHMGASPYRYEHGHVALCLVRQAQESWDAEHPAHPWDRAWRWPVEVDVPADGRKE